MAELAGGSKGLGIDIGGGGKYENTGLERAHLDAVEGKDPRFERSDQSKAIPVVLAGLSLAAGALLASKFPKTTATVTAGVVGIGAWKIGQEVAKEEEGHPGGLYSSSI